MKVLVAAPCGALALWLVCLAHAQPAPDAAATPVPAATPGTPADPPPPATPTPDAADIANDVPKSEAASTAAEREELACLKSDEGCQVDDLKTPTVPAFAIIGISPSDVETPRSPKALALALYNAYNGGAVAQDVALDVAPYWLFAHPMLTYEQYVNAPALAQLAQNASVSIATAPSPDDVATDIGVGFRTHVLFVDAEEQSAGSDLKRAEKQLDTLQKRAQFEELQKELDCANKPALPACQDLAKGLKELSPIDGDLDSRLSKAGAAVQEALTNRSGILIGLAGAISSRSAADEFAPKDFQKAAGWVNVGYRGSWLEAVGLVRLTGVDAPRKLQYIDLGAKIGVFKPSWDLHAEVVYRAVSGEAPPVDNSARVAGTFEFEVTDEVFVTTTFGKAADDVAKQGKLFGLFGLNFQAGKRRVKGL